MFSCGNEAKELKVTVLDELFLSTLELFQTWSRGKTGVKEQRYYNLWNKSSDSY